MKEPVEADDVAAILSEALPEFAEAVEQHRKDWPDSPMLYLLIGPLFWRMVEMPDGPERRDFVRRVYTVTDAMLANGSPSVRDCFAIEMIEPLSSDSNEQRYPRLEAAVGPVGRKELENMREWARLYRGMKAAVERANAEMGSSLLEVAGIGEGNASASVFANLRLWDSLTKKQHDEVYRRLSSDWEGVSGRMAGVTISGPRESNFRLLRGQPSRNRSGDQK